MNRFGVRMACLAGVLLGLAPARAPAASFEVGAEKDFNTRAAAVQPGDEIVFQDGVYADWKLSIPARGTAGRPIVIRPRTPGGVLFRRATEITLSGDHLELRGLHFEHCGAMAVNIQGQRNRVTDCRFLWCGNPRSTFSHILEIGDSAHDNRVDHCHFEGSKSMSVGLRINPDKAGQRNRVDHNVFRDIFPLSSNGQESVQLGQGKADGDAYTVVEYNLFDNASGDQEFISNKSSYNVLRYNVAVNTHASLTLRGGDHCRVEGNVLIKSGRNGIRIHGADHVVVNNLIVDCARPGIVMTPGEPRYEQVLRCLVAHNTIVNCKHGALAVQGSAGSDLLPTANRILNNLLTGREGLLLDLTGATNNEVAGNLFWPTQKATAGFMGSGAIRGDPLLAGENAALHPQAGSAAIDRALPLADVKLDRRGAPRPAGPAADIGADEAGSEKCEEVALPAPPPARAPFDFEAAKGGLLFAMDAEAPMRGMVEGKAGRTQATKGMLALRDAEAWLAQELPSDFAAEWEYSPAALTARGAVRFAAPGRQGGYTLGFGGADGTAPDGVIMLAKGGAVVADGHDTLLSHDKHPSLPNPKLWYTCRLLKRGGCLRLDFGRSPIVIWDDTGRVGGPALGGGALGFTQAGDGSWRKLRVWRCKAATDKPGR